MFRRGVTTAFPTSVLVGLLLALWAAPSGTPAAQTLGTVVRATQAARANPPAEVVGRNGQVDLLGRPAMAGQGAVFGSTEFPSGSLAGLPQWTRVLGEMAREREAYEACAREAARCTDPALRSWRTILEAAAGLERRARLEAVNAYVNRWPYRDDRELYGRSEYWASPSEFLARSGDCEDYAIAKYFALRRLGFGADELRIVILMDEIRAVGHAVLAVYQGDDILILDSQSNLVLSHARYKHYVAQYSMNETTRWAHVGSFEWRSKTSYQGLAARR